MLKFQAFSVALVYANVIATQKTSVKVARNMRTLMKPYMDFSAVFEQDRNEILKNADFDEEKKKTELKILCDESIELPILSDQLLDLCEEGNVELTATNINDLFCHENVNS